MAEGEDLRDARERLASGARALLFGSAVSVIAVLVLFDWNARDLVLTAPIGMVLWGAVYFFADTRRYVPTGPLPEPPPRRPSWRPGRVRSWIWLGASIPLSVGLAWLADAWDLGTVFVPGQWLGAAVAQGVALALVWRWEHRHRRRVVFLEAEDGDPVLYAAP